MLLGLGWPEWFTIILLVGGLWLTFWLMARASVAYDEARRRREREATGFNLPEDEQRLRKEQP